MTKTTIYLTFMVQTMIIKLHNFTIICLMSEKKYIAYEDRIIIGGDLNCPMNPMLDNQGGIMRPERKLLNVLKKFNRPSICMTFGGLKPKEKSLTWSQKSPLTSVC